MIKIKLNEFQRKELERLRLQDYSKNAEKSLMRLLSMDKKAFTKLPEPSKKILTLSDIG